MISVFLIDDRYDYLVLEERTFDTLVLVVSSDILSSLRLRYQLVEAVDKGFVLLIDSRKASRLALVCLFEFFVGTPDLFCAIASSYSSPALLFVAFGGLGRIVILPSGLPRTNSTSLLRFV